MSGEKSGTSEATDGPELAETDSDGVARPDDDPQSSNSDSEEVAQGTGSAAIRKRRIARLKSRIKALALALMRTFADDSPKASALSLATVVGALLLILIVTAYVITPTLVLLLHQVGAKPDGEQFHLVASSPSTDGRAAYADVVVEVLSVDPVTGTAEAEVAMRLIRKQQNGDSVHSQIEFASSNEGIEARLLLGGHETRWPVISLITDSGRGLARQRTKFNIYGAQEAFPSDAYSVYFDDASLRFSRPIGVQSTDGGKSHTELHYTVPVLVRYRVVYPPDFQLAFATPRDVHASSEPYKFIADFVIGRGRTYILFVYALCMSPVLISLAFYAARSRRRSTETLDNLSPLELATAFLALLTLRQVLVPTNVSGTTNVDRLLAVELTVIVAVTLVSSLRLKNSFKRASSE